tara:strand:- start:2209 stop:2853 length:645 start_codon:yes stop_codon:yes gene_type:complete
MDYAQALWLYLALLLGIIALPGMDMFLIIANALTGGRRRGLATLAGVMLGGAVHTVFGTLAVGVLTHLPGGLYTVMIVAGAGYMAWIGWSLLGSSITVDHIGKGALRSDWSAFVQGAVTCLLNPKAYLFVLAVFPQFMRPQYGPLWSQALVLGLMTISTQFVIYGALALAAGRGRDALIGNPGVTIWFGRSAGLFFILAAAFTAWHGINQSGAT